VTLSEPPVKKSKGNFYSKLLYLKRKSGKVDKVIKSDELDYIPEYEPPPPPKVPGIYLFTDFPHKISTCTSNRTSRIEI
jgi:hypothetical protein